MHHHDKPDITGRFDFKVRILGGIPVAEVTGNFSLNVNPVVTPPTPLALAPTSGALPNETEGTPVQDDKVANVSGGTKPYNVSVTGLPSGVSAVEVDVADGSVDIVLEGTPDSGTSSGSPYTVAVDVTDSSPAATASARRPLTVR